MLKYNKKLVLDYVSGNDIKDYTIDELEDDYQFMIEVINYTNDKRIYDLCSDNVKNNYNFVKFIVDKFKKDISFIVSVADNYLNHISSDDITYKELIIYMSKLKCDRDELMAILLRKSAFESEEMVSINYFLANEKNESLKNKLGLGFVFIIDNYGSSEIIMNHFAKCFVNELLYKEDNYLEFLLHKKFKTFDELKKQGINTFLVDYIGLYDQYLSLHISTHLELLDDIKKDLVRIDKNWDNYNSLINKRKINILNQEFFNYIDENHVILSFDIHRIIKYFLKKYGFEDIFNQYDDFERYLKENGMNTEVLDIDESKLSFVELKCLKYISDLVLELFKDNTINEKEENISERKNDSKILSFNINKKL